MKSFSLKSLALGLILVAAQSASAAAWDIWQLRDKLDERAQVGQSLFCNSASGKFNITVDNGKNIILNALIYNGGLFGPAVIENQLCETTLDEVMCSFGTGKWIDVDLRKVVTLNADGDVVNAKAARHVMRGSVKASFISSELEQVTCTLRIK
jgi:hypothetical protein